MIYALLFAAVGLRPDALQAAEASAQVRERLPEVVVTASGREATRDDLAALVSVVDREEIHRASARIDVADALRAVPGIVVRNRHNYAQDLQVAARGYGSRATFGVRGVRLYVNGIPATAADGQGQLAHAMLDHATRIEVLRGPFAALFGNASGGVIQVVVDPMAQDARASLFGARSGDSWRVGATTGLRFGDAALSADVARFDYAGFRPHSEARRDTLDVVAGGSFGADWRWNATFNGLDAPRAQDPLGLTRADFERDPDSTAVVATLFDTRKRSRQSQAGAAVSRASETGGLKLAVYGGERDVEQFLAVPVAAQGNPLHAGGVIDLGRDYGGLDARAWRAVRVGGTTLTGTLGLNLDEVRETRRGYENFVGQTLGVRGARRRDERNRVRAADAFAQLDWDLSERWRATLAARASRVRAHSDDRFVTSRNPDDSGTRHFAATTPVVGLRHRPSPAFSWHLALGEGFETPTLNELSYRADGGTGLNVGLDPARSRQAEIGMRWAPSAGTQLEAAWFDARTADEIVVASNSGGRASFSNAGRTRRRGLELALDAALGRHVEATLAWTSLEARFRDAFAACSSVPCTVPSATVAARNRLPGVPAQHGFAELRYRPSTAWSFGVAAEHFGRVPVDDHNRDTAAAYTTVDVHATRVWTFDGTRLEAFVRVSNIADRRYAGSVIVNEANARYFEPAPGRRILLGFELTWM